MKPNEDNVTWFSVQFEKLAEIRFQSCTGMNLQIQPVFYESGGRNGLPLTARGNMLGQQMTFTLGTTQAAWDRSDSVGKWLLNVSDTDQKLDKRNGRINLENSSGEITAQWQVKGAWPSAWSGPLLQTQENELTIETMTFVYEGIERSK